MPARFYSTVITGGPCAGKSTVLSFLAQKLADYGWDVYTTKEAATELMERGVALKRAVLERNTEKIIAYQKMIAQTTMHDEARMFDAAQIEGHRSVLLCDRGVIDIRAYLPEGPEGDKMYKDILSSCGTSPESVAEMYNGVVKLTTAADGAVEHYTCDNNKARHEGIVQACYLDKRIESVYLNHSDLHVRVIDNSTDFEGKKHRTLAAVCSLIGIPVPIEMERKYKVEPARFFSSLGEFRLSGIEQTYLISPDPTREMRVRKRTTNVMSSHYLTRKKRIAPGKNEEEEEIISAETYNRLLLSRDPERNTIYKTRRCFIYQGQFLELDEFHNLDEPLCILEIERTEADRVDPILPPALKVICEVTENPEFSNHQLALRAR